MIWDVLRIVRYRSGVPDSRHKRSGASEVAGEVHQILILYCIISENN